MRSTLILGCLLFVAAPARAQRCDADLETCARQAYESGEYALALARFRAMLAEGPTDALRLAVAQSLFQLGRMDEALAELDRVDPAAAVGSQAAALRALVEARRAPAEAPTEEPGLADPALPESEPGARPPSDPPDSFDGPADGPDAAPEVSYSPSWLLFAGLGATVVGGLTAAIAGAVVLDAESSWNARRCVRGRPDCDGALGQFEVAAPISTAGFVVAGVGLGLLILELAFGVAGASP